MNLTNKIEISELTSQNFPDFIKLLGERGYIPADFYDWKYMDRANKGIASGYVAYKDHQPVGCIGIINKIFVDRSGTATAATWFADWYVSTTSRGTGAGKALMNKVADTAPTGLGIPGPLQAQAVASKAGYKPLHGFIEVQIPLRPWRVGHKRYSGTLIRRLARGLREVKNTHGVIKRVAFNSTLTFGFPPIEQWLNAEKKGLQNRPHFQRSNSLLEWLQKMPVDDSTSRRWWHVDSNEMFAAGFIEKDTWGLQRCKVMELISFENKEADAFKSFLSLLHTSDTDLVVLLLHQNLVADIAIPQRWQLPVPLHITATAYENPGYLSLLDKESSWRELTFINE